MRARLLKLLAAAFGVLTVLVLALVGLVALEGRRQIDTAGEYVALGSSFAAGLGLGARAPASPLVCLRTQGGYPGRYAAMSSMRFVDASCSGATVSHVLKGGQAWQGPQINAVGKSARLVTLTAGGNDVGYVGDLTRAAYRRSGGLAGWVASLGPASIAPAEQRDFDQLAGNLRATLQQIRERAPSARIVVATYPEILPAHGVCDALGVSEADADVLRTVASRLAEVTRDVAATEGAEIVDMASLSVGHDACSADPWVNGFRPATGAPFHPNHKGAQATALAIQAIALSP